MRIAIIGTGAAGLVAIKHCVDDGHDCEAFEQTEFVGGTWNYTDEVGIDKNGLPIHTSMYKDLRTNLPKELMMFEDFPYPDHLKHSYILHHEVLQYLNHYADQMNLRKHIKFLTRITYVEPISNEKWSVEIQDVITKNKTKKIYDVVICCSGKYSIPYMPVINGLDSFTGRVIHSHNYRSPESFRDRVVLVIGGGPSGIDIYHHVMKVAKKAFLSLKSSPFSNMLADVLKKPPVHEIMEKTIVFEDGSSGEIDDIILCTGYVYDFSFLSEKCRITVEENYVKGLYKELICAEFPNLIIMGIPGRICPFPTFELQMRCLTKMLRGDLLLPSHKKMMEDIENERRAKSCPNRHFHNKGIEGELQYWNDLAELATIKRIPIVFSRIHEFVVNHKRANNQAFRIINDEDFEIYTV